MTINGKVFKNHAHLAAGMWRNISEFRSLVERGVAENRERIDQLITTLDAYFFLNLRFAPKPWMPTDAVWKSRLFANPGTTPFHGWPTDDEIRGFSDTVAVELLDLSEAIIEAAITHGVTDSGTECPSMEETHARLKPYKESKKRCGDPFAEVPKKSLIPDLMARKDGSDREFVDFPVKEPGSCDSRTEIASPGV